MAVVENDHRLRTECRLCDSKNLERVLSLTKTPPANALVSKEYLHLNEKTYPLDVYFCADCGHTQLLDIVNPNLLFRHYLYVSSITPVMVNHLREQAKTVISKLHLKPGDLVVEIGSNDGTLLRFFKEAGMRVLGIDPAKNIADKATKEGIETIAEFFDVNIARHIAEKYGKAKAICANNVCAHIDDLQSVIKGVQLLLAEEGQFVFEVGYLLDVVQKTLFDTIYHEHVDFHRVTPLKSFFNRFGMTLIHAEKVDIQGGALRGYVCLGNDKVPDASVAELELLEKIAGLNNSNTLKAYAEQIEYRKIELMSLLKGLKEKGKRIAAYGSPAKATTLMYHFGLDGSIIDYIVEDNVLKQGYYTPGFRVPILPVETLYTDKPDYILVLAWNFADLIIHKHKSYAAEKGRFIVPLPNLKLVGELQ